MCFELGNLSRYHLPSHLIQVGLERGEGAGEVPGPDGGEDGLVFPLALGQSPGL